MKSKLTFTIVTLVACALTFANTALAADPPPSWFLLSPENGPDVELKKSGVVRYECPEDRAKFREKTFAAGQLLQCNNATFAPDPAEGCLKRCITPVEGMRAPIEVARAFTCPWGSPESVGKRLTFNPSNWASWLVAPGDQASFIASWGCLNKYGVTMNAGYGYKQDIPGNIAELFSQYSEATTAQKMAMIDAGSKCKVGMDLNAPPCSQYKALNALAQQQMETNPPVGPIWRVAKNGTYPTRPTKIVLNGVRTATNGKETVLVEQTTCECQKQAFEEAGGTYCSVEGAENISNPVIDKVPANRVALCALVKPPATP